MNPLQFSEFPELTKVSCADAAYKMGRRSLIVSRLGGVAVANFCCTNSTYSYCRTRGTATLATCRWPDARHCQPINCGESLRLTKWARPCGSLRRRLVGVACPHLVSPLALGVPASLLRRVRDRPQLSICDRRRSTASELQPKVCEAAAEHILDQTLVEFARSSRIDVEGRSHRPRQADVESA